MTIPAPAVGKTLTRNRDKFPLIRARMQGQFEHAKGVIVANFAVLKDCPKATMACAAGAGNKLADAIVVITFAGGVLGRKAFIIMVVTVDDHFRAGVIED